MHHNIILQELCVTHSFSIRKLLNLTAMKVKPALIFHKSLFHAICARISIATETAAGAAAVG